MGGTGVAALHVALVLCLCGLSACAEKPPTEAVTLLLDTGGKPVSVSHDRWMSAGKVWERRSVETGAVLDRYRATDPEHAEFGLRFDARDPSGKSMSYTVYLARTDA